VYEIMNLPEFERIPGAVAIDLDGTLLNSQTRVSERNRTAVAKCAGYGIPVIIATSRAERSAMRLTGSDLSDNCSFVTLNGAVAKGRPPLSGHYRESTIENVAGGIIDCALEIEPEATIGIELDGYKFGANWAIDAATLWEKNSATPDMLLSLEEALELKPSKINIGGTETRMLELAEVLRGRYGDSISVVHTFFDVPMIMITTGGVSKPNALRKLLNPAGIPLDNVVALGDDIPDIDLFRACGIPVAMANAVPEIKAICSYETASNDNDGVAVVLEKITEVAER
jgi:HAD superfamily hydrolase (TIGR01484 family)